MDFLVVTQKMDSSRRKRKKIVGILRTFICSPKFRDLRANQEKEKKRRYLKSKVQQLCLVLLESILEASY